MAYDHIGIEKKWQKYWEEGRVFSTENPVASKDVTSVASSAKAEDTKNSKPKKYILDMFPYPSGAGLHVGHPKGYTATDIVSRYYHATGHNVLHAMGFDAFGLPAENYAIKTGIHPAIVTKDNIETFITQLKGLGFSYDWDRMVDTTDPEYYKWTQWIFLELFKKGLAYEQDLPINYCPSCKTGLANEEVLSDNTCDRCGTKVERRPIRQWVLKITDYADRLLSDIDDLDWPEGIKEMQRNWIGKSEGCEFTMRKSDDATKSISVYTTRVDTVYGMTYAVLAPDHPSVEDFITIEQRSECEVYIEGVKGKSDQDRTNEGKEKTGVWTGSYVINPYNNESVPLWIADYVLGSYGTGAVMAVPAHDERDFAFAKKYDLPIKQVIAPEINYTGVNAAKSGVETLQRNTVDALIENQDGEFLLLQDKETRNYHFVGGGIDGSESEIDALKREIVEETGFIDFDIIGLVNGSYSVGYGYRYTKGKNQRCLGGIFHVRLKSDKRIESEIESGKHGMTWFKKEDIKDKIGWDSHKDFWNAFMQGDRYFTQDGILFNSEEFTWKSSSEARDLLSQKAENEGFGKKKINYKLRDWLFSRQRYWGEPIPLIHISNEDYLLLPRSSGKGASIEIRGEDEFIMIDGVEFSQVYTGITGKIIIDSSLPLTLPEVEKYEPAGDGQSPLATVPDWVNIKLADNLSGKRETNTMPQWGGSCWYYLRYMDNKNPDALASREALDYWGMVDEYVGGAEHAVLHLLYARFWHKVLYDIGVVPHAEPFQKLTNVGMILAYAYERKNGGLVAVDLVEERDGKYWEKETGEEVKQVVAKMSKSLKNVVNPSDIVIQHGADTLRLYEMSMSAFTDTAPWNPDAIIGVRRFLDKAYGMVVEGKNPTKDDMKAMKLLHKTIKKVGEDIKEYKFNTAIAALQILLNEGIPVDAEFREEWKEAFTILLHPFAPHMAEELYSTLGKTNSVYNVSWPEYDEFMLIDDDVVIAIQIGGKLRGTLNFLNGVAQEEVSVAAMSDPNITKWLEGKVVVKEIFIPNKMLSIVVRDA